MNNLGHSHNKDVLTSNTILTTNSNVIIDSEAYLKIVFHSLQYANRNILHKKWIEVMGWLSGEIEKTKDNQEIVHIKRCWAISHGDAVSVSIDNYGLVLSSILGEIEKSNENEHIIGWYHSHPGYGIFMSQTDFDTQKSYQKLFEKAIAIVIDQSLLSSIHFGIKIFRLQSDLQTFEGIPFALSEFDRKLLPKIVRIFNHKLETGSKIKEYDSK